MVMSLKQRETTFKPRVELNLKTSTTRWLVAQLQHLPFLLTIKREQIEILAHRYQANDLSVVICASYGVRKSLFANFFFFFKTK